MINHLHKHGKPNHPMLTKYSTTIKSMATPLCIPLFLG